MTGLLNPDLVTRARALARIFTDAGYATDKVDIVVSDGPVPDCPRCLDDGDVEHEALIEIFYDDDLGYGSVYTCRGCLMKAAAVAASESQNGWFHIEVTQRSAG